jgi:hypothetical protein
MKKLQIIALGALLSAALSVHSFAQADVAAAPSGASASSGGAHGSSVPALQAHASPAAAHNANSTVMGSDVPVAGPRSMANPYVTPGSHAAVAPGSSGGKATSPKTVPNPTRLGPGSYRTNAAGVPLPP